MSRRSRDAAKARRRPVIPARTGRGNYINYGPQALDQVSGLPYPRVLMVPQRGGLVSEDWADGTRDALDPIDHKMQSPAQLPVPVPLYRLATAAGLTILVTDEDARDEAVEDGYSWTIPAWAYTDGDEEADLALLYRAHKVSTGDTLFTTSAVEYAAALVAGYVAGTSDAYVSATAAVNRLPIYRALNAGTSVHTWVTSAWDIERLGSAWANEGIQFYAWRGPERTRSN